MTTPVVTLSVEDLLTAGLVGLRRRCSAIARNSAGVNGARKDNLWESDVVAAQAELAVAKYLNLAWYSSSDPDAPDVGRMVEVRCFTREHDRLCFTKRDKPARPYVGVFCNPQAPTRFVLAGWLWGREGMDVRFEKPKNNGAKIYFVDQELLRPIGQLVRYLTDARVEAIAKAGADGRTP